MLAEVLTQDALRLRPGGAVVLDPGADVDRILSEAKKEELKIVTIVNTQ